MSTFLGEDQLFHLIVVFQVMGFMYFDSTMYKLASPFWLDGLGFWLPASFPSFTCFSWNQLLNQRELALVAGYIALVFEFVFIFLFWVPAARVCLVLIGLVLHLGIAVVLPLPLFGLLMVALYLLFLPDPRLSRLLQPVAARLPAPPPLSPAISRCDELRAVVLVLFSAACAAYQATLIAGVPVVDTAAASGLKANLGLCRHTVFGRWQFTTMSRDIALVYVGPDGREEWVPWLNEDGHVGSEGYSRFWSFWWAACLPDPERPDDIYADGKRNMWARAAEGWAVREERSLQGSRVVVKVRPVRKAQTWERDRHRSMELVPWADLLQITWMENGRRHFVRLKRD